MSNKNISLASFINVSFLLLILCFSFNSYSCAHLKNKAKSSSRAIIDNKISSPYSVSLLQESSNSTNTTTDSTDSLPVNASTIKIEFESTNDNDTTPTTDSTSDTSSKSDDSGSPNLSPDITADDNSATDSSNSNSETENTDNSNNADNIPTDTNNSTSSDNSNTTETTPVTNNSTTTETVSTSIDNSTSTETTPTTTETTPTPIDNSNSTENASASNNSTDNSSHVSSNQITTSNESSNSTTTTTPDNTTTLVINTSSGNSTETTNDSSDNTKDKLNAEVIITRTNINDLISSINGRVNVVEEIILLPVGMLNKTSSEDTVSTIIADENNSDNTNSDNTVTPADTDVTETITPTESTNAEDITEPTDIANDANATAENTENSDDFVKTEDLNSSDELPASTETTDSTESDSTETINLIDQNPAEKINSSNEDIPTATTAETTEEIAPINRDESDFIESSTPEVGSIKSTDNIETTTSTETNSIGDSNASTQSTENIETSTVTTPSTNNNSTLITEDTFIDNYSEDETDLKTGEVHSIRGQSIITLEKDSIDGTEYLNINSTNITTTTKIDSETNNSDVTIPISHSQANKIKGVSDNDTTNTTSDVTPTVALQTGSRLYKRGNKLKATVLLQQNTNTNITINSTIENTPTEASYFNTSLNTHESNTEKNDTTANTETKAKTNNTELENFMNNEKIRYTNETSLNKTHFEPLCYIFIESSLHRVSYRAELINPFPTNSTSAIEKYLFICEEEFVNIINELNHLRKEEFFSSKLEKELSDFNSKYPPTISTDLSDSFFSYNYYKKNIFKAILVKMGFIADTERPSFDEEYKNTVFINRRINTIIKESFLIFVETYQNKNVNNENLLKQSRSLLDMSYEELIVSKAYIKWQTQFLNSNPELNMNEESVNSKIAIIYTDVFNYVRNNKH